MTINRGLFLILALCGSLAAADAQNVQARWIGEPGTFNGVYDEQDPVHFDRHQDAFAHRPSPGEVFGVLYKGPSESILRVFVPDKLDEYGSVMVGELKGAVVRATDGEIHYVILSGPEGPQQGEYELSLFDLSDWGDVEVSNQPNSPSFRMAAVHMARRRFGEDSTEHLATLERFADALIDEHRVAEAGEQLEHSLRIEERLFGKGSEETIETVRSLANLYREGEMYAEAIPFYRTIVERNRGGSSGPFAEQARDAYELGFVLYRGGDHAAAAEALEESAAIHASAPGRDLHLFELTLRELGAVHRKMGNLHEALLWYERAEEFVRTSVFENTETHANALNVLGVINAEIGHDARAISYYRQAIEMRTAIGLRNSLSQATTHFNLAVALDRDSAFGDAVVHFRRSMEIYEYIGQVDTVAYADVMRNLANTLNTLRELDEAVELSRRAIDIYETSLPTGHNLLGVAFNDLGLIYRAVGDYDDAEKWLRRSLENRGALRSDRPIAYATVLENLAGVLQWQGIDEEAEQMFRTSLEMHRKELGPDHHSVGRAANNLGFFLLLHDRHWEAEALFRENLDIAARNGTGNSFGSSSVRINLGDVLYWSGRYLEAAEVFQEARDIRAETIGRSDPRYANAVDRLADSYRRLERHYLAQPLYEEALAVRAQTQGTDHFEYAATAAMAALTEFALGNTARAERLVAAAIDIRARQYAPRHYLTAVGRANYGAMLTVSGDYELASDMLREAGNALPAKDRFAFFDYVYTLTNLAEFYRRTDRLELAHELVESLAEISLQTLGSSSRLTATAQHHFGQSLMEQGRLADAADAFRESIYTVQRAGQSILPHLSAQDAATLRNEFDRFFWSFAGVVEGLDNSAPWVAEHFYDLLLIRSGVLPAISSKVRNAIEAESDADLSREYERWRAWVSQLEPPEPVFPAFISVERRDYDRALADAQQQRLVIEGMTEKVLDIDLPRQVFWNTIQQSLEPGEIAVEVIANPGDSGPAYAAAVVASRGLPKAVFIERAALDPIITEARDGRGIPQEAQTQAALLLWGPILDSVTDVIERIYVRLDGLYLHATGPAFAELTSAEIVPVATTRDLID